MANPCGRTPRCWPGRGTTRRCGSPKARLNSCCPSSRPASDYPPCRCARPMRTRCCDCPQRCGSPMATPSIRPMIWSPTAPWAVILCSRGLSSRSTDRRPGWCRCIGSTTIPGGRQRTGGCGAGGSCCSAATPRPGSGCRWTRSAGVRRVSGSTPIHWPRTATCLRLPTRPRRLWRMLRPHLSPPSSPRSGMAGCSFSCRRRMRLRTSST